jgi:hypothetical protein
MGWSEAQRKAYAIADNKLSLNAGWDEDCSGSVTSPPDILAEDPSEMARNARRTAALGSIGRKDLVEYSDAELIAIIGSAIDVPATLKDQPAEPNFRGFLELVADGQYRPKE